MCSSCKAQYSVSDAKVQGRRVRVSCKHCGHGIIIDGTTVAAPPPPPPAPPPSHQPLETVPAIFDALRVEDDDATRVIRKLQDYSVHDEPTVIGRIPQEALDAERRFAQRTVPPPKLAPPPPEPEAAHPVVPEAPAPGTLPSVSPAVFWRDASAKPLDPTNAATPHAIRQSRAALESADNDDDLSGFESLRPPRWPWLVAALLVLTAAFLLARAH